MRVTICFSFGIVDRVGLFCSLPTLNSAVRIIEENLRKSLVTSR